MKFYVSSMCFFHYNHIDLYLYTFSHHSVKYYAWDFVGICDGIMGRKGFPFLFVWLVVVIRFQQQQQHFKRNIVLFFVWLEKYYFMFYSDMLILMNTFYVLRRNHVHNNKKTKKTGNKILKSGAFKLTAFLP